MPGPFIVTIAAAIVMAVGMISICLTVLVLALPPLRMLTVLWITILLGPMSLRGQEVTGTIRLQVNDPSGTGMRASGRIEGADKGSSSSFRTSAQGQYEINALLYGRYKIEVMRDGFETQTVWIDVQTTVTISHTITMVLQPQAERVDVVGATPLPGTDIPLEQIPGPVQTATSRDIEQTDALDLADLLNRRLSGVYINENQENPFQPDLNYRGYTASPLLGTPEGLSVYMDGVRQNQAFGDIVDWDLIPKTAISEVIFMPGSNPLFGLNTLGGALSIETKDGISAPGSSLEVSGGSFGRRAFEFENGGSLRDGINWYVAGNLFHEDGWRVASDSDVRQGFSKLGWRNPTTALFLSGSYADNELHGNGLQDFRSLNSNYRSVYSIPDITWDRSPSLNFSARRNITGDLTLSGNIYARHVRTDTNNGDINEESFDQSIYNLSPADITALTAAGYHGFPTAGNATTEPFPFWRCIAQGLEKSEPIEKCTGLNTRTSTRQSNYGLSGQVSWLVTHNHITMGAGWDRSNLTYQQKSQFGYLNPDRVTLTLINTFADGSTNQDGVPIDTRVNLSGLVNTYNLYAADVVSVGKSLAFTISGRYNHTSIDNADRLPLDSSGARGSLSSRNIYSRFNPSVGATYSPWKMASVYFNYSEASRPPTAIELGCADPTEPCNFPNALVSDPPLKQVIARTLEAGMRGSIESKLRWNLGWFRAENYQDLLFVASEQTGFGFFTNFGQTRRQGAEINLGGEIHKVALGGSYTFLAATYQSSQTVDGGSNSTNDGGLGLDGNITVKPGDQIPQIPRHMFKAFADFRPTPKITLDLDFRAASSAFARGNENNLDHPDGVYYLGPGTSSGYGIMDLGARYQLQKRVQLFVQIDNVFNHHYSTAAQLGPSPFDNSGNFVARPFPAVKGNFPIRTTTFLAPGAPTGAWGGIRFRF